MDTTILEDLGLTTAEIKVYISLLELRSAPAGEILSRCKLHNSVMHRALNSLTQKSLINYSNNYCSNIILWVSKLSTT